MPVTTRAAARPVQKDAAASWGLPTSVMEWSKYVMQGHERSSLISINPQSTSDANIGQFYMLKTLYFCLKSEKQLTRDLRQLIKAHPNNDRPIADDEPTQSAFDRALDKARNVLASSTYWSDYQNCFDRPNRSMSLFGLVSLYQRRSAYGLSDDGAVGRLTSKADASSDPQFTPTKVAPKSSLKRELSSTSTFSVVTADAVTGSLQLEDEEIVNVALILFVNALVLVTPPEDVLGDWWPCRSSFTVNKNGAKVYTALVDGMFRIEGASYQQIREQTEHKDRYLSPNSTFNAAPPAVTEVGKASSSLVAESVEEKGTRKSTRNKQNPRPDYNESRKSMAPSAGRSRTRGSEADKGRDKEDADKRVVSGSGLGKTVAARGPQALESASIGEATQETSKDLPGEDQPALPAADDEDGDASPSQKISDITMIAEVKRMARGHSRKEWRDQILIQESAQMAAWIADVPVLLGQKADATGR